MIPFDTKGELENVLIAFDGDWMMVLEMMELFGRRD